MKRVVQVIGMKLVSKSDITRLQFKELNMALKHVCAYCGITIKEGNDGVSHGICKPCFADFKREHLDKRKRKDWKAPETARPTFPYKADCVKA